jgi:hypothetical protein
MSGSRVSAMVGILLGVLLLSPTAGAQQIVMDANSLAVREGNATLLRYRYGDVPFKPYIQELLTPSGVNVLLDAPPDHLHHHALMFACAVNNVDFWGEAVGPAEGHFEPLPGKQQHLKLTDVGVTKLKGRRLGYFGEPMLWVSPPHNEPLLVEHRYISAGRIDKYRVTFLTWQSLLSVPTDKECVLSGSHYHGLGMRFIRSMDATGEFRNPDNDPGVIFRGEERLTRSRWCAYTAQADGKTVTVAMFDHPDNPRSPATWFTMAKPFAYMSATLRLHEKPLKMLPNKPLTLHYGVALWDGRPESSQIEEVYVQWLTMLPRVLNPSEV